MPKENKIVAKAQKTLNRAEALLDLNKFDRAQKEFIKAAEMYRNKLKEFLIAEQCYFFASKALVHEGDYLEASYAMRDSANCCILVDDYSKAADYYDISAKYALKAKRRESEFRSILSASFAYLCWFIKGQQEKGLAFIKRIKKNVDTKEFAENKLIRLVKGLTLAILNKDESALAVMESDFESFKFRDSETKLIKDALLLAKTHLLIEFELIAESKKVQNEKELEMQLEINFSPLKELIDDEFIPHVFKSIKILDVGIAKSDNLAIIKKPTLPLKVDINSEKTKLKFRAKANFPGEGFIGPIVFTIELDDKLFFYAKTKSQQIIVTSPPAQLGVNLKPLVNPIINQTFPMEVKISNPSDADVVNIAIELEFPKSLRLMRGTNHKKIYQLVRNEEFKWEIHLKPLEPGNHIIKATLTFFDQDNNQIGPKTADLPFDINL